MYHLSQAAINSKHNGRFYGLTHTVDSARVNEHFEIDEARARAFTNRVFLNWGSTICGNYDRWAARLKSRLGTIEAITDTFTDHRSVLLLFRLQRRFLESERGGRGSPSLEGL